MRARAGWPDPRRSKAVDNGGLRYGAAEGALRPPLPTATQSALHKPDHPSRLSQAQNPRSLDRSVGAQHHRPDPRKRTLGVAGFKSESRAGFRSESVAGFLLELVAGFVGIRSGASSKPSHSTPDVSGGDASQRRLVNTPPPKGGGFGLRLKAGSVGPLGRLVLVLSVSCRLPFSPPPLWVGLAPALLKFNAKAVPTTSTCSLIPCGLKAGGLRIPYRGL